MVTASDQGKPVVEANPDGDAEDSPIGRSLGLRIRQQEILAELGVVALQGAGFDELLNNTARLTAEGLVAEFCKVLEYLPAEDGFVVRAGVGWDPGVIGAARVGADLASPAGFALKTGKPVISNHLENEERFRTPELLLEHGVRRAINVILQGDGKPFGVLEVDSQSEGEFNESDIAFLQGAANLLGMAIERQRYERDLEAALARHEVLLKEINHRAKNSLQVVASMLRLQAGSATDPALQSRLLEAAGRIDTIGHAYERLAYDSDDQTIGIVGYLRSVTEDLEAAAAPSKIRFEADVRLQLPSDRAILLALVVNELVTNAAKYAYPDGQGGPIDVRLSQEGRYAILSVEDRGIGLPADFDLASSKKLGSRLVSALAGQLAADLTASSLDPGTGFVLRVPLD